jgi:hypothetical protein
MRYALLCLAMLCPSLVMADSYDVDAQVALALAAARSQKSPSVCRCGPDCPLGGDCGANCRCASPGVTSRATSRRTYQPSAATLDARARDGWQWDASEGHWFRYRPAPMAQPVSLQPSYQPAPQQFFQSGSQAQFGGGSFGGSCSGGR